MGRIVHEVRIAAAGNNSETITVDALVDTGTSITALPVAVDMQGHRLVPVKYLDMK